MYAWLPNDRMASWLGNLLFLVLVITCEVQPAHSSTVDAVPPKSWDQFWDAFAPNEWPNRYLSSPFLSQDPAIVCQRLIDPSYVPVLPGYTFTYIGFWVSYPTRKYCKYAVDNIWGMHYLTTKSVYPVNVAVCPPATPAYKFNPATQMCERQAAVLAITLSGGTEVEPSKGSTIKTLPFIATVIDQSTGQPPTTPVTVKISLKVDDPTSGGHAHGTSDRPRGGIANVGACSSDATCWSETSPANNGVVVFNFNAPEASGTHTITATCEGCSNNDSKGVAVKVVGLEKIPEIPFLYTIKLPNRDTNHPATYFLTKASAERLKTIALYYYAFTFAKKKQGVVPDFVLNDASLEWGGVLDCFLTCNSAQYPSTPWHKHHVEHRRGSVVDIKANGDPGSVVYDSDFKFWAAEFGVDVGRLHGSGSGLHYHLRLNNGAKE